MPRKLRVAGDVQQLLSEHLLALEDPRLLGAGVTRVELSDDLQSARVFVRIAVGPDDPTRRQDLLRALRAAAGRLRHHVGRALGLRFTPELHFHYDRGPDAAWRVEEILAEIRGEGGEGG
ncbi:MAG: 30S ribosome-binding factor RbfA [Deltaproteobacteria bacterium]|nr:30S ribosome-binding factor RbfA [Deltaproteobacteria bacterium]